MIRNNRKFYAELKMLRSVYDKLDMAHTVKLSSSSADMLPNQNGCIVLRFERNAWFFLCGELYALMLLGVKCTVTLKEGEL